MYHYVQFSKCGKILSKCFSSFAKHLILCHNKRICSEMEDFPCLPLPIDSCVVCRSCQESSSVQLQNYTNWPVYVVHFNICEGSAKKDASPNYINWRHAIYAHIFVHLLQMKSFFITFEFCFVARSHPHHTVQVEASFRIPSHHLPPGGWLFFTFNKLR